MSSSSNAIVAPVNVIEFSESLNLVAFGCTNKIKIYDFKTKAYLPWKDEPSPAVAAAAAVAEDAKGKKKEEQKVQPGEIATKDLVNSMVFYIPSEQGVAPLLFAAIDKSICVYQLGAAVSKIYETTRSKRINSLLIRGTTVVYSNKFGEVYQSDFTYQPNDAANLITFTEEKFLLSHVSVITDALFSPKGDYILTADRDEKIRVSNYPVTYEIQSFCLGHKEFVSKIVIPSSEKDLVISGSGDGTLRIWNYIDGTQIAEYNLKHENQNTIVAPLAFCPKSSVLAVLTTTAQREDKRKTKDDKSDQRSIILFTLAYENGVAVLKEKQRIETESEGWTHSGSFDNNGRLWLCRLQSAGYPIAIYELSGDLYKRLTTTEVEELYPKLLQESSTPVDEAQRTQMWNDISWARYLKRDWVGDEEFKQRKKQK